MLIQHIIYFWRCIGRHMALILLPRGRVVHQEWEGAHLCYH